MDTGLIVYYQTRVAENNPVQVSFCTGMTGGKILSSEDAESKVNSLVICNCDEIAVQTSCRTWLSQPVSEPFSRLPSRMSHLTVFILNSGRGLTTMTDNNFITHHWVIEVFMTLA